MTLATPPCSPLEGEHKSTFDKALQEQEAFSDYLADCKMKRRVTGRKATNHQPQAIDQSENGSLGEDVMIVEASGEPSVHNEGGCVAKGLKFKLLQFHLDHRPAYWGTWQKKSSKVNPRNPFKTDKVHKIQRWLQSPWYMYNDSLEHSSALSSLSLPLSLPPSLPPSRPALPLSPPLSRTCWTTRWTVLTSGRRRNPGRASPTARWGTVPTLLIVAL